MIYLIGNMEEILPHTEEKLKTHIWHAEKMRNIKFGIKKQKGVLTENIELVRKFHKIFVQLRSMKNAKETEENAILALGAALISII